MKLSLMMLALIGSIVSSAPDEKKFPVKHFENLVRQTQLKFEVPGVAVAIVKDGKIVLAEGFGKRSILTKSDINKETLFGIASNTKAFTAATLGLLVEEGKLKWEDKVTDYIPEFKLYDPWVTSEFTVIDLLTHRSGLGLGAGDLMFFPDSAKFTIGDIIHNLRYLKPVSSFRSKYDYDNLMYMVAGEIVKRVSGKSWEKFVEEKIFNPLGMKSSAASFRLLKKKNNVIDGHAKVDGSLKRVHRHISHEGESSVGGIYTNLSDITKWIKMLLNKGKFDGKEIIKPETIDKLWTPVTIMPLNKEGNYRTNFNTYGLGWDIYDVEGFKTVSHTGALEGMVSQIKLIPELNLGIAVFTNQQVTYAYKSISNWVVDYYLGLEEFNWLEYYYKKFVKENEEADKIFDETDKIIEEAISRENKIDLTKYIGLYKDIWFGNTDIKELNGDMIFESEMSPKLKGKMYYFKDDTFVVKWDKREMNADAFIKFEKGFKGEITGFKMRAISPLTDFSYDFHDLEFIKIK